ncbi:adenosylcobinamide-phosphate synthase CbiB [Staphylococcus chromogenes]|nr:adenosylcobinamide-phosphate synthase CbiB [Staphylococcus chromogenes]
MTVFPAKSAAIATALLADRMLGDPQRHHPVAYFGSYATVLERALYADSKVAGLAYVATTTLPVIVATHALHRRAPFVTTTVTLWAALGGRTLERTGAALARELAADNEEAARAWIPWLCSRDPGALDATAMARAGVESVAENTSDAAIAPIFWAAVGGAPAVALHRCINTLDAMVGYRTVRYAKFGWAAARLDDALAYLPARLTAAIHVALAATPITAGSARESWRAWRYDAAQHPSPNAGPVEATAAGALGVQLGGATAYRHGVEQRPVLGRGRAPSVSSLRAAVRLCAGTQLVAAGLAIVLLRR